MLIDRLAPRILDFPRSATQTYADTDAHTHTHTHTHTCTHAHTHTLFELQRLTLPPDAANAKQGENDK